MFAGILDGHSNHYFSFFFNIKNQGKLEIPGKVSILNWNSIESDGFFKQKNPSVLVNIQSQQ